MAERHSAEFDAPARLSLRICWCRAEDEERERENWGADDVRWKREI